jgi:lambda family phage portal protein
LNNTESKQPLLERAISAVSPSWALRRAQSRSDLEVIPQINAIYRSSAAGRTDTQWSTTLGYTGANHPLNRYRLTRLRDRARDLERNNAIASGMLDRAVENVVGHGFRLQATTGDEKFNTRAEELWGNWTQNADICGTRTWTELQRLIVRSFLRDGDVGCALVSRGSDCKLQPVPGDQIDTMNGGYDLGNRVLDGIQFNAVGRPIAFYLLDYGDFGERKETVVSANDFVFLSRLKSLTQVRGEPVYSQVFKLFDQVDGYIEAVVVAARVAACQALYIRSGDAAKQAGLLQTVPNSVNDFQPIKVVEPGSVIYGKPGDEITQITPMQPTQSFPDFVTQLMRFAGLTLGLPLELVMLDFSRTNYSSARASLLQAYRAFKTIQQQFSEIFLARVYRWRISKWVKDGTLKVPDSIAGDIEAGVSPSFWRHNWISPGWAWVDPTKEIQAAMMEVDAGLNTLTNIAAQHGLEWNEIVTKRAQELRQMETLNVPTIRSSQTRDPLMPPATAVNAADDEDKTGPVQTTDSGD